MPFLGAERTMPSALDILQGRMCCFQTGGLGPRVLEQHAGDAEGVSHSQISVPVEVEGEKAVQPPGQTTHRYSVGFVRRRRGRWGSWAVRRCRG